MKKGFMKWQLLGLRSGSGLNKMLKLKIHSFISHIIKKVFLQIWHNNFFLDKLSCLGNSFRYFLSMYFFYEVPISGKGKYASLLQFC